MENWLPQALFAFLLYGLWAFFPKIAVNYISPTSAVVYEVAGSLLVGLFVLWLVDFHPQAHPKGILFAVLTGVAGMLGTLFFFAACVNGKISVVASLTAIYPLVTVLLAVIFLREPITVKQLCGMIMAMGAIILLAT